MNRVTHHTGRAGESEIGKGTTVAILMPRYLVPAMEAAS